MAGFTFELMREFAVEGWGDVGAAVVDQWAAYNQRFFGGELRPIPLVIEARRPLGNRVVDCTAGGSRSTPRIGGRLIRFNIWLERGKRVADNGALLHAMLHQLLLQRGENAEHSGAPWRREIMRLTEAVTGKPVWAGRSIVKRVPAAKPIFAIKRDGRGKERRVPIVVQRVDERPPDDRVALTQQQIARWPEGSGVDLGRLGIG